MHHKNVMIKIEIGECKECSRSLEKILIKLNGIESVEFIKKNKTLKIVYNPAYISEPDIHRKIAEVGYDTELVKATDQAYNNLLECCKYKN
jgi:copper chaperone CopZ